MSQWWPSAISLGMLTTSGLTIPGAPQALWRNCWITVRPSQNYRSACVHADYSIFSRLGTRFIEVIHILHGARDYEVLLFPTD
jgi:hypothetical protein